MEVGLAQQNIVKPRETQLNFKFGRSPFTSVINQVELNTLTPAQHQNSTSLKK